MGRPASDGSRRGVRLVEVAIDAAGAGGSRPYTYAVPERLADLEDGEAVMVEFGRRQALGVVLGSADDVPGAGEVKPIVDRVRADGPLLPPLTLALARWIAAHYLAPPALVIRSMLPPGLLERLELVAELAPAGGAADGIDDPVDVDLLDQLSSGARPARELAAPDGRAGLLRRLRSLADRGLIALDWTLLGASGGPRYERWLRATPAGRDVVYALADGERPPGRPLGPRQIAALGELAGSDDGLAGPEVAGRHGTSAVAGLVRRGLVEAAHRPRHYPLSKLRPSRAPLTRSQGAMPDHSCSMA
jgi:primosomal protein N' (replication factor Y)